MGPHIHGPEAGPEVPAHYAQTYYVQRANVLCATRKRKAGLIINPRRACAARVTVVGSVCVCVCVCVCLLSQISPLERLFVLKILSRTQRATEIKKFVGFSLKPLRSKVMASFAYPWHPTKYCSDIPRTFSTAEPSKGPKKANNRLNTTWNTTG